MRATLPEPVWETEARFLDKGMVASDARRLCISPRAPVVTRAIEQLGTSAVFLGVLLSQRSRAHSREGLQPDRLTDDAILEALAAHARGRLAREGVDWLFERLLRGRPGGAVTDSDVRAELDNLDLRPATDQELDVAIDRAVASSAADRFATPAKYLRHLMGELMTHQIGRVDGRRLLGRLRATVLVGCQVSAKERLES